MAKEQTRQRSESSRLCDRQSLICVRICRSSFHWRLINEGSVRLDADRLFHTSLFLGYYGEAHESRQTDRRTTDDRAQYIIRLS